MCTVVGIIKIVKLISKLVSGMSQLWFSIGFGIHFLVVMLHNLPSWLVCIKLHILLLTNVLQPFLCYLHVVIRLTLSIWFGIHVLVVVLHHFPSWLARIHLHILLFFKVRGPFSCYLHVVSRSTFSIGCGINFLVVMFHDFMKFQFNSILIYFEFTHLVGLL